MKIIKAGYEFITPINAQAYKTMLNRIEVAGRTCYKSEDRITDDSAEKFVRMLIKRGHEAMIEHCAFTVKFTIDRGVSHEMVRHRIASFAQESTRYCNYSNDKFSNELTFIRPLFWDNFDVSHNSDDYRNSIYKAKCLEIWEKAMYDCETHYFNLIQQGAKPEEARSVLPNSLKTEIVVTMNLREWRHYFKLRTAKVAHPQIREVSIPLLKELQAIMPAFFEDIEIE